jgi:hypothetical protein
MNATLVRTTVALLLVGGLGAQTALAKDRKHKEHKEQKENNPARNAAVQQCRSTYEAAAAAAHARNGPTGNARKRAMHTAAEAKKDCVARAPR